MATAEMTFDQVLDAVRRWPLARRKSLVKAIESLPPADQILATAGRLRGKYRMGTKRRRRMSELLGKGSDGTLTPAEREELDALVEEFEQKALEMAQDLTDAVKSRI